MQAQSRCLVVVYKSSEPGWPRHSPFQRETLFSRTLQAIASFKCCLLQRQEVTWDTGVAVERGWPAQRLGLQVIPCHFPVYTCF